MAGLDTRLAVEVDRSAAVVTAGRQNLDGIKQWVTNAASQGNPYETNLDLDRLLHHEERHSQQWAKLGQEAFIVAYGEEWARERWFGGTNWFEKDAGLHDGGYK